MTLNLTVPTAQHELAPRITVVGVGGAGGNAVNNMIQANLEGVDFLVCNTDAQALEQSLCDRRIQLGRGITQGLGAGSRPDVGRAAAEEALDEMLGELESANMVFVTAGMGGGTGTGGAPVIARAAREAGILTVGVITKPFHFEGVHRMRLAEAGIAELSQYVDTLIIIPNQNLFRVANEKTTFADAFKMADDVLHSGVRGVTDLMVNPGLINLDFADIRAVMSEMGKAMMGTGEAEGDSRAIAAAEAAISNPLLDEVSMKGARGVLINITGGLDLTLFEVDEAANRIRDEVDPEANIIFGSTFDQSMESRIRVSVVATGIDVDAQQSPRPVTLSVVAGGAQTNAERGTEAQALVAGYGRKKPGEQAVAEREPAPEEKEEFEAEPEAVDETISDDVSDTDDEESEFEEEQDYALEGEDDYEEIEEPRRSAAPARAAGRGEAQAFVAPEPVRVPRRQAARSEAEAEADADAEPFAAAALANASRSEEGSDQATVPGARVSQSLFARVTGGAARALQAATQAREAETVRRPTQVQEAAPRVEPSVNSRREPEAAAAAGGGATPRRSPPARPRQEPASAQPFREERQAPARPRREPQPRLSGLDLEERKRTSEAEEELLDIPAFLRRQAN